MKYIQIIVIMLTLFACGQGQIKTPENAMGKFEEFKQKEKFIEDSLLFYPGLANPTMKKLLSEKINKVADDFKAVAESETPTDKAYLQKIDIGLKSFSDVSINLDIEDKERVCTYFEELMNIVGLKSSNGPLNEFMYRFDPTKQNN